MNDLLGKLFDCSKKVYKVFMYILNLVFGFFGEVIVCIKDLVFVFN